MAMKAFDRLVPWIVGALVTTVAIAAVYGATQQNNRASADDAPQALISQLVSGEGRDTPATLPSPRVELTGSRMPFYVVYGDDGRSIAGDGYLDGRRVRIPDGVLRTTIADGSDHVTWEPRPGLRFALTTAREGRTVIAAGQSLTAFEQRTDRIGLLLVLGWLITLAALTCGAVLHLVVGRRLDP
ncbi:hypothetical protein [Leifsonia xyli]|uniref:hypothetical protein n=1 Tax=Leifsonia xyli TaxID=1575 RepID=UPI003D67250D